MKGIKSLLAVVVLGVTLAGNRAPGQTPPILSMQSNAGVGIAGTAGNICAIQTTTNLTATNGWICVSLVQLLATNYVFTNTPINATSGPRFYRAVITATNFALILPGTFTMGSPTNEALRLSNEGQHDVTITKGFYIGKYLLTQGEYLAVAGNNPSFFTGDTNRPVEQVSWYNATNYCALRTAKEQAAGLVPTNWTYRLPTESEWEYACRAGTTTAFYLGSALHSQQANFDGTSEYDSSVGAFRNPNGVYLQTTTVGGVYASNNWGLYDMVGNLVEWCQDWYGTYPTGSVIDPQGFASGSSRVMRGGDFGRPARDCRSAIRYTLPPATGSKAGGFRVVLAEK